MPVLPHELNVDVLFKKKQFNQRQIVDRLDRYPYHISHRLSICLFSPSSRKDGLSSMQTDCCKFWIFAVFLLLFKADQEYIFSQLFCPAVLLVFCSPLVVYSYATWRVHHNCVITVKYRTKLKYVMTQFCGTLNIKSCIRFKKTCKIKNNAS